MNTSTISIVKYFLIIFIVFTLTGCSASKKSFHHSAAPASSTLPQKQNTAAAESKDIKKQPPDNPVHKNGVVFGKTDFQGILQTNYVRLILENLDNSMQQFQLNIGDQPDNIWEGKTVQPGYFFIELPAGKYKISSISIPVGSTLASEQADMSFEVMPHKVVYIGTLKVIGTKEKIKLGGVPVIQPGFEYNVEILDERDEGIAAFRKNYPNIKDKILIHLLKPRSFSGLSPMSY